MQLLVKPIRSLLFFFLLFGGLYFAKTILVPLTIGGLLAMLCVSVSDRLERKGVNKGLSAFLCVFSLVLLGGGIILLVAWQASDLVGDMADLEQQAKSLLDQLRQYINHTFGLGPQQQKQLLKQESSGASQLTSVVTTAINSFFGVAVDVVLVLVYTFLFLYFRDHLKRFLLKLIPADYQQEGHQIVSESSKVARQYLMGLATMIVSLWVLYSIGFSIVGVKHAIFLAILCGLLEIIPFVGNLTGSLLTILISMAQGGDTQVVVGIIIVYGLVQFTQTYLLEPLVVGAEISINPLFTILILVVGEAVWGIPGMILALPVLGMVKIICDHIEPLKPYGFLIGSADQKETTSFTTSLKKLFTKK